jgi:hypothetical protein
MSLEPNMVVDLQHKLNKLNDESRQLIQEIEHPPSTLKKA